jgi:lipopolysaccharide export system permease protein
MHFNAARTDLYLTLYDGVVHESSEDPNPGGYHQIYFRKQIVPLRGVGNEMERQMGGGSRSDREMTTEMLAERAASQDATVEMLQQENLARSRNAVRFALGYPVDDETFVTRPLDDLGSESPALARFTDPGNPAVRDHVVRRLASETRLVPPQIAILRRVAATYRLEIHKKYSLATACLVFVLIGAPLAVRFPRGGLGMVIAASSVIFGVYWIGLIGGENLADAGRAPPWLGMWAPNVVFGLLGLLLVRRMGREAASMRGGGWDDLLFTLRQGLGAPFRRLRGGRTERRAAV